MRDESNSKIVNNKEQNLKAIYAAMENTDDLMIQHIENNKEVAFEVLFLSSLADPTLLMKKAIPLQEGNRLCISFEVIVENLSFIDNVKKMDTIDEITDELIQGHTVFLFSKKKVAISVDTFKLNFRSIKEPDNEIFVKGPHDGFNESLSNNISLVRFHLPTPKLKVEYRQLGTLSKHKIAILSLSGIVNQEILEEVHKRIGEIPYESIFGSNYIEEWITDNRRTIFPLIESTERPDRVAAALSEGRVAIITNGTPFVVLAPFVFLQTFQVGEDYYWNYYVSSIVRLLRFFCGFITMFLPAFYVSTTTFHQELIPTALLLSIVQGREPVPFPAIVEALIMEGTFEILREAGVRLPKQVGQAVSIVGALVMGQAGVQAGIVSPIMVIVVSFTGICSFTLPAVSAGYSIRLLRFIILLSGATFGYVGIMTITIMILIHLVSLRSFGIPYLAPLAPLNFYELTDIFIRRPLPMNNKRPSLFHPLDLKRYRGRSR